MMLGTTNGRPAAVVREDEITMEQKIYWTAGQALTKTCMDTYTQSNTGLGAEIVHYFNEHITPKRIGDRTGRAWFIKRAKGGPPPHDAKYMLRPETVESIFVSWRLTGDPIYRYGNRIIARARALILHQQRLGLADLPSHRETLQSCDWWLRNTQGC